jgi:transcriptional regulator with XRE-family HTH domain
MPEVCQSSCLSGCRGCAMKVLRFGGKIDLIRRAQDLTIHQLSDKSGVKEKTLERICEGHGAPCAAHFVRIIKALHISLDAIEPEDLEEEGAP